MYDKFKGGSRLPEGKVAQLMKVLIVLENVVMDGVKRAATVVGNDLNKYVDVTY